jgi:hypothetical protein
MKYTNELVHKACAEFVPTLVENKHLAHLSLPELLQKAGLEIFKQMNIAYGVASFHPDKAYAALIIQDGLKEVSERGFLEFGEQNGYWGAP